MPDDTMKQIMTAIARVATTLKRANQQLSDVSFALTEMTTILDQLSAALAYIEQEKKNEQ